MGFNDIEVTGWGPMTSQTQSPIAPRQIPTAPIGADPIEWRKKQTDMEAEQDKALDTGVKGSMEFLQRTRQQRDRIDKSTEDVWGPWRGSATGDLARSVVGGVTPTALGGAGLQQDQRDANELDSGFKDIASGLYKTRFGGRMLASGLKMDSQMVGARTTYDRQTAKNILGTLEQQAWDEVREGVERGKTTADDVARTLRLPLEEARAALRSGTPPGGAGGIRATTLGAQGQTGATVPGIPAGISTDDLLAEARRRGLVR